MGWPRESTTKSGTYHGGSGGYIYIKTTNIYGKHNNAESSDWIISASGGDGKENGFGGSGGIIIVDGNFGISQTNYKAFGGRAGVDVENSSGCGTGAAGTIYFKQVDLLYISNDNRITDKKTVVSAKIHPNSVYPTDNMVSKSLWIQDGANVAIRNSNIDSIIFPLLRMEGFS